MIIFKILVILNHLNFKNLINDDESLYQINLINVLTMMRVATALEKCFQAYFAPDGFVTMLVTFIK